MCGCFETLQTGFGAWNPLVWLVTFGIALMITYIVRGFGEKGYKKGTPQTKPFISGNEVKEASESHIRASNLYWGYLDAMKPYYKKLIPLHTGITTDYALWFFGVLAVVIIIGLKV